MDADERGCPLLVLDLDETLIHAVETPLPTPPDFRVGPYYVYKRPGLAQFLDHVSQRYELAVWSSAGEDYVEAIAKQIWTAGFSFVWSRGRCIRQFDPETFEPIYLKDLKKVKRLGYDLNRILIVDDSPEKLTKNYGNAVYAKPFEGDQSDNHLAALSAYLESIADSDDFRAIEKRGWWSRFG